jgi:DNA-binding HxlR family transcriptional regulator
MKRYGQVCPLARALDVVGDRWSLLIVRELMVGPRRYTDLIGGLPGIGTNVLAARLRDLSEAELVTRRALPPPTAVTVYELTDAGRELGPTLATLRRWGAAHAPASRPGDAIRPAWLLMSAAATPIELTRDKVYELRVGNEVFRLASDDTGLSVRGGSADHPDTVVTLEDEPFYDLITGRQTVRAVQSEAVIECDHQLGGELLAMLHGAVRARLTSP